MLCALVGRIDAMVLTIIVSEASAANRDEDNVRFFALIRQNVRPSVCRMDRARAKVNNMQFPIGIGDW